MELELLHWKSIIICSNLSNLLSRINILVWNQQYVDDIWSITDLVKVLTWSDFSASFHCCSINVHINHHILLYLILLLFISSGHTYISPDWTWIGRSDMVALLLSMQKITLSMDVYIQKTSFHLAISEQHSIAVLSPAMQRCDGQGKYLQKA